MTIETVTTSSVHVANGVGVTYSYDFKVNLEEDLIVYADGVVMDPVEYIVSGLGDPNGGTIETVAVLPDQTVVLIERVVDLTQETSYPVRGPFPSTSHEDALDKLTMIAQQQQADFQSIEGIFDRAVKFPEGDPADSILPDAISRADKVLAFDVNGDIIVTTLGGGGLVSWGDIVGTLSNQADLQAEIDALEPDLGLPLGNSFVLQSDLNGIRSWMNFPVVIASLEPDLGDPAVDGYVLTSTAAGVRSWVAAPTGAYLPITGGTLLGELLVIPPGANSRVIVANDTSNEGLALLAENSGFTGLFTTNGAGAVAAPVLDVTPAGVVSFNSIPIVNISPSSPSHVANKQYVDELAAPELVMLDTPINLFIDSSVSGVPYTALTHPTLSGAGAVMAVILISNELTGGSGVTQTVSLKKTGVTPGFHTRSITKTSATTTLATDSVEATVGLDASFNFDYSITRAGGVSASIVSLTLLGYYR